MSKIFPIIAGLFILVTFVFGLIVLNSSGNSDDKSSSAEHVAVSGPDTSEGALELFLNEHKLSDKIAEAYRFALANPDGILDEIPCYCGCMETNEHLSNRDCFVEHPREESDQVFDKMGLNCGVCVATALDVKEMVAEGSTLEEIQKAVDDKFLPMTS